MNLFDRLPKELFSILASPNKVVYSDALLVLYDAFQENLKISKDTLFTMLRSRLENALVYSSFEDEGIEEDELQDLSGKARFLIRKLRTCIHREEWWIDEGFLMPHETKKRHKADAYGDFLGKRGAKISVKTPFIPCEYRF